MSPEGINTLTHFPKSIVVAKYLEALPSSVDFSGASKIKGRDTLSSVSLMSNLRVSSTVIVSASLTFTTLT